MTATVSRTVEKYSSFGKTSKKSNDFRMIHRQIHKICGFGPNNRANRREIQLFSRNTSKVQRLQAHPSADAENFRI
jgi:hypothetical protein